MQEGILILVGVDFFSKNLSKNYIKNENEFQLIIRSAKKYSVFGVGFIISFVF